MPVTPSDFNDHKDRIKSHDDEISMRCAISRGYYHAFHMTRQKGSGRPEADFNYGPGDHGKAKQFLKKAVGRGLSDDFDDLHSKRKKADYELNDTIDDMDLAVFEHELEEFILKLKQNL